MCVRVYRDEINPVVSLWICTVISLMLGHYVVSEMISQESYVVRLSTSFQSAENMNWWYKLHQGWIFSIGNNDYHYILYVYPQTDYSCNILFDSFYFLTSICLFQFKWWRQPSLLNKVSFFLFLLLVSSCVS